MEEDFYFSKKQFIKGLMMPKSIGSLMMRRGDVSLAKINGVWILHNNQDLTRDSAY